MLMRGDALPWEGAEACGGLEGSVSLGAAASHPELGPAAGEILSSGREGAACASSQGQASGDAGSGASSSTE